MLNIIRKAIKKREEVKDAENWVKAFESDIEKSINRDETRTLCINDLIRDLNAINII